MTTLRLYCCILYCRQTNLISHININSPKRHHFYSNYRYEWYWNEPTWSVPGGTFLGKNPLRRVWRVWIRDFSFLFGSRVTWTRLLNWTDTRHFLVTHPSLSEGVFECQLSDRSTSLPVVCHRQATGRWMIHAALLFFFSFIPSFVFDHDSPRYGCLLWVALLPTSLLRLPPPPHSQVVFSWSQQELHFITSLKGHICILDG